APGVAPERAPGELDAERRRVPAVHPLEFAPGPELDGRGVQRGGRPRAPAGPRHPRAIARAATPSARIRGRCAATRSFRVSIPTSTGEGPSDITGRRPTPAWAMRSAAWRRV